MCGPCGAPDEQFSTFRQEMAPRPKQDDFVPMTYQTISVKSENWINLAAAQAFQPYALGGESIAQALKPEVCFKVVTPSNRVFYFRKEDALKLAVDIFKGTQKDPVPLKDLTLDQRSERIANLCAAIEDQAKVAQGEATEGSPAAIMKKIDQVDEDLGTTFTKADEEFTQIKNKKDGYPGSWVILAKELLQKRKGLVNELRAMKRPNTEINLLEHKNLPNQKRFDAYLVLLTKQLNAEQEKVVSDIFPDKGDGKLRLTKWWGGTRDADDHAKELRPIVVNLLSRAVISGNEDDWVKAEKLLALSNTKGFQSIWNAILKPEKKYSELVKKAVDTSVIASRERKETAEKHELTKSEDAKAAARKDAAANAERLAKQHAEQRAKKEAGAKDGGPDMEAEYKKVMAAKAVDDPFAAAPTPKPAPKPPVPLKPHPPKGPPPSSPQVPNS